jgi:hypothetical protein
MSDLFPILIERMLPVATALRTALLPIPDGRSLSNASLNSFTLKKSFTVLPFGHEKTPAEAGVDLEFYANFGV